MTQTEMAEIHAHNIIAQVASALESGATADDVVPIIADLNGMDPDLIADDVADVFEHVNIAKDLREDPTFAFFMHFEETYHGGDVERLINDENERAEMAARRIVATLRAEMAKPADLYAVPPCE